MLRIYPLCLDVVRRVKPLADQIAEADRDQARQLRRSVSSVPLNVAEGSGSRAGNRRARYENALGSARETMANLEVAEAIGFIGAIDPVLRDRLDQIIATLVKLVR